MAEVEGGSLARALLYRAAVVEIVPAALAESVAKAFALGQEEGRYPTTVRAFMPALRRIPPSTELIWFAPTAITRLRPRGRPGGARRLDEAAAGGGP